MLEKFFDNPGRQIKSYAKIVFILEVIAFLIAGVICLFSNETIILGLSLIIGGIPASYITNLFLFAFGDLAETSSENKFINAQILAKLNEKPAAPVIPSPVTTVSNDPASVFVPKAETESNTSEKKERSCKAVLSYALQFSTIDGMRRHIESRLKFCDNQSDAAVYQTLLANSDENLRAAIENYLNA